MARSLEDAAQWAIQHAKRQGKPEVTGDDLLLGCLVAISRFGVARVGAFDIDLAEFGVDWRQRIATPAGSVAYSNEVVRLLDEAAAIAQVDGGGKPEIVHMLACYSAEQAGLMGEIRKRYGVESAGWRAALSSLRQAEPTVQVSPGRIESGRPFFSPEEAAEYLGIHIQTIRGYLRSGKLKAFRIAGERAIRIRREDIDHLLEPFRED